MGALFERILAGQRDRYFLWAPVFLGIGIALYFALPAEPFYLAGVWALSLFSGIFYGLRHHPAWVPVAGALFFIALGVSAAQFRAAAVHPPLLDKPVKFADVAGTVSTVEDLGIKGGVRIVLKDVRVEDWPPEKTPRQIRLRLKKTGEGVRAGDRIAVLAALHPPSPPVTPGAFDFRRQMYFEGIGATGFSYRAPEILARGADDPGFFGRLRERISGEVRQNTSYPFSAVVDAFLTGQRGAIREEDNDAMRGSSLYHLLSISGMHVVLMAGGVFFAVRLFLCLVPYIALHWPVKKIAAAAGLAAAGFYVLLVGAEVPALRSLFMTGMMMVAIMIDRSPFSMRMVALAAFLLLLAAPESLTGVSFQMSFAAVAGMIAFYDWSRPFWMALSRRAGFVRRAFGFFLGVIVTSVIAGVLTGLFSLYHFQNFSAYGVLANMMAVPIMSFVIMPATALVYLAMPLGIEAWPMQAMEWGVSWILATAHWVAGLAGAVWHVAAWPAGPFYLLVAALTFMMLWRGWRGKAAAVPVAMVAALMIFIHAPLDIQVSETGKVMSVRTADGKIWVSTRRTEKFTIENWMRRNGQEGQKPDTWPKEGTKDGFPLLCDPAGCRGEISGRRIAIARTPSAIREDCPWADVLISPIPVPKYCEAETVVDLFDLKRAGAHALWLNHGKRHMISVYEETGVRLWSVNGTSAGD
jgi:competence protein ComEC